jgi:hypothetical protein
MDGLEREKAMEQLERQLKALDESLSFCENSDFTKLARQNDLSITQMWYNIEKQADRLTNLQKLISKERNSFEQDDDIVERYDKLLERRDQISERLIEQGHRAVKAVDLDDTSELETQV